MRISSPIGCLSCFDRIGLFCSLFLDHETALSAVRNLNGKDVGGRPLRIDLADSDPFLEGRTTMGGQIIDGHHPRLGEKKGRPF